jgi:GT2 family glycosyltransferase
MWYKTNSSFYFVSEDDNVWRVWKDGYALRVNLDPNIIRFFSDEIDTPEWWDSNEEKRQERKNPATNS